MSKLTITGTEMLSDTTRHTAALVKLPSPLTGYSWQVTWLPGRHLTRDGAITAMTIAEVVASHDLIGDPLHVGHHLWVQLDAWAHELGLSGPRALALASMSPEDIADAPDLRAEG
jgi:hypothetical protein